MCIRYFDQILPPTMCESGKNMRENISQKLAFRHISTKCFRAEFHIPSIADASLQHSTIVEVPNVFSMNVKINVISKDESVGIAERRDYEHGCARNCHVVLTLYRNKYMYDNLYNRLIWKK